MAAAQKVEKYSEPAPALKKRQVIDRELSRLAQEHGGALTPELVLEQASDRKSPLHDQFEWDDSVAGRKYRLEQAHRMIMSARVVYELAKDKPRVRSFVPRYNGEKKFLPRGAVMADKSEVEIQKERALDELRMWLRRWVDLPGVETIRESIKAAVE